VIGNGAVYHRRRSARHRQRVALTAGNQGVGQAKRATDQIDFTIPAATPAIAENRQTRDAYIGAWFKRCPYWVKL
jgi:hypothetical protein